MQRMMISSVSLIGTGDASYILYLQTCFRVQMPLLETVKLYYAILDFFQAGLHNS